MTKHDTPATYTSDEAHAIRVVTLAGGRPTCPRCAELLLVATPVVLEDMTVQEVTCPSCHRCVILRDEELKSRN